MRVRHIGGRVGTAVALGAAAVLALASAGTSQAADPVVVLDRSGTAAGESMLVTGTGWEPGATLLVELCGRGGLGGSTDCDVPHQATAGVGPGGRFSVELEVGKPPSPCPCVVKAMDQESRLAATAAIAVAGIPTVPITQEDAAVPTRAIEVSGLRLRGGRWPELFGAGGRRWLDITLVNTGAVTVTSPELSIAWGSGAHPTGFVSPPEIESMEPGETQDLTISLDRPMFAFGDHTAVVEVQGVGAEPVIARTSTTGYPWGLLAIALVILQLALLRIRNRFRRRLARRRPTPADAPALASAPLALAPAAVDDDAPTVIDLDAELEVPTTDELATPSAEPGAAAIRDEATSPEPSEPDMPAPRHDHVAPVIAARERRLAAERHLAAVEGAAAADLRRAQAELAELQATVDQRMAQVEARHEEQLELLDAVWRRANELAATCETSLIARREEITVELDDARRAVEAVEAERIARVAAARKELEAAEAALASTAMAEAGPDLDEHAVGADRPRAPRIGDIDQRMARAVERALASMGHDSAN